MTFRKLKLLVSLVTCLLTPRAYSQDELVHGIYKSKDAFVHGELTEDRRTDSENYLLQAFDQQLYIVTRGLRRSVPLDSIFGYSTGGHKYRAVSASKRKSANGYYRVEDVGAVVVYSRRGFYKTASKVFYYFSREIDSPILPLDIRRLRREFPNEELIDELRRNRWKLTERIGKNLRVNKILQGHLK